MRALAWLVLCTGAARAAVPEPAGFWQGPPGGEVPASIAGGQVIHTAGVAALLARHEALPVDVAAAPRRPANMAAGALWLPLPHLDIPGSIWLPQAGQPTISPATDSFLRRRLAPPGGPGASAAIVVYCHPHCWLSWNAAKRFISYGVRTIYWYPDGMEGWTGAGYPAAVAKPEGSAG